MPYPLSTAAHSCRAPYDSLWLHCLGFLLLFNSPLVPLLIASVSLLGHLDIANLRNHGFGADY